MRASILSILPFVAVIPVALLTRQVIAGLVAGLLVGSFLLTPDWLGGFNTFLAYLFKELAVPGNLHLVVFLWAFGALTGLMQATGGVSGFARWLEPRVRSARSAFAVTWLSALATFMAPDFRIITVAPIMRPVSERFHVARERLAYAIDVTSTPLIALIPVGTVFVGYMLGLLSVGLKHIGLATPAFPFFLSTIPLNFFAWAILAIGLYLSFAAPARERAKGGTRGRLRRAAAARQAALAETGALGGPPASAGREGGAADRERGDAVNLIAPIALLLVLIFFLTWWSGHLRAHTPLGILVYADAAKAMLQAALITLLAISVFYAWRRQPLDRIMNAILRGGNEMMPVIVLLALVWAVSGAAADLGFVPYVSRALGSALPRLLIAPGLFVLGSVISYFIGSSFGTWGILMPLGFSLAASAHLPLALAAGAVFASGTLGGFASPLSDNTVAMATVLDLPPLSFARTLLGTTVAAGAAATVGYAAMGLVM